MRLFARMSEFDRVAATRCQGCNGPTGPHPEQFGTVTVEREWHGPEQTSLEVAFAGDADIASIKRDCPSMELKRTKAGFLRPVSRNDKHDRDWKRQLGQAVERYRAQQAIGSSEP